METRKTLFRMRAIGIGLMMVLTAGTAHAQFLRTSYFMEGTHYRQQLNPALAPGRGYINLPVIGSFSTSVSSKSLSYGDIMDIADNSSESDFFTSDDFMNRLNDNNQLNINMSTEILSAGWYKGRNFWSVNLGLRVDMGASIHKKMFEFMRQMDGLDVETTDWSNFNASMGSQSLEISSYAELGVGYARAINERLTIGGKAKLLLGIGNLKLDINKADVSTNISGLGNMESVDWGNLTQEQLNEIVNSSTARASIDVDATLESSFKGLALRNGQDGYIEEFEFDEGELGVAGYGFGIDLGASYKVTDQLTLSAAVLDLGFISWGKGSTTIANANTSELRDMNLKDPDQLNKFTDIVGSGEVLNYEMLNLTADESASKGRTSWLYSTLVIGGEYSLMNDWLVLGALSTTRFTKPKAMTELTLSANIRPKNYFNASLSYSMIQSMGKSFGLAIKIGPLFVGTDYMFFGESTKAMNAYLGISIPLNKSKYN